MKKLFIVIIVLSVLGTAIVLRAEEKEIWKPSGYLSFQLQQRYIGLCVSRLIHDDELLWSEFNLNLPKGFFVDLWYSYGLDDNNISSNYGDEIETQIGWAGDLFKNINLGLSITLFNTYPIGDWWDGDIWLQTFTISKKFEILKHHFLTPKFQIDWISETNKFKDGATVLLPSINYSWQEPFGLERLTLFQQVTLAWDDGINFANNNSDGFFFRWEPNLCWELYKGKHNNSLIMTLPGITILTPLCDTHDNRKKEISWNCALKYTF